MISKNYLTFLFYLPRTIQIFQNWDRYLFNYLGRRRIPAKYRLRNGFKLIDATGTLAGTIAVVFLRQEYGKINEFRTIIDIGANMGAFAIYAAWSSKKARIYCFEPEKNNFSYLQKNVNINSLDSRIFLFKSAVASKTGKRSINIGGSPIHSFYSHGKHSCSEKVDCVTIRNILDSQNLEKIDLLKLNCEGAEYEILDSCTTEDFQSIKNIRLEYHNLAHFRKNGEYIQRLLRDSGYSIQRLSRYRNESGFIWASREG